MPSNLQALFDNVRAFLRRPDVQAWLPNRKVLVGAVAALLVRGAQVLGGLDFLPAGWSEIAAFAIVAYLIGESEREPVPLVVDYVTPRWGRILSGTRQLGHKRFITRGEFDALPRPDQPAANDTLQHEDDGRPGEV